MTPSKKSPFTKVSSLWFRFWNFLIAPHPELEDDAQRREAKVVASLLIILIPLYFLPEGIRAILSQQGFQEISYFIVGFVSLSTAYVFARGRRPQWGAHLAMLYFTLIPFFALAVYPERYQGADAGDSLVWSAPIIVMGLILLRPEQTKKLVFFTLGVYLILPTVWVGLSYDQIFPTFWLILAMGILLITAAYFQQLYLKQIITQKQEMEISETRYREMFIGSPVALWETDFSQIKRRLDVLIAEHGKDLTAYISSHPEAMDGAATNVLLLEVNQAALDLYETDDAEALKQSIHLVASANEMLALRDGVIDLRMGGRNNPIETIHKTLKGNIKNVVVRMAVGLGSEETWERVIISITDVTERRAAETSARQLASAVAASASSIVITNLDGNIEYVNPAFSQVTGYTEIEALGNNPRVLKSGEHTPEFYQEMWQTLVRGETWQGEIINKKKNGKLYWEYASISPVKDDEGMVVNYVAVKDDITQRKEAETTLRQLASAVEASASSVVITDLDGGIEYVNPAFSRVTGYSEAEALGENPRVLKSGQHTAEFYQEMWDVLSKGETWHGEIINKKKNGELYWEHASISPVKDDAGVVANYVAVKDDITQAKQAEREIRRQSEFLQTIIDGIDSPFYVLNVDDYSVVLANKKAKETGISNRNHCYEISHNRELPCDGLEHPCPLKQVMKHKEPYVVEHIHYRVDGSPYYVEVYGYPIYDENGEVVQMIEYSVDITARKKAEEQAEKLLHEQIAVRKALEAITSTLDLDEVLRKIAAEINDVIDATSTYIWLWNEEEKTSTNVAEYFSADANEAERVSEAGRIYDSPPEFIAELKRKHYSISHLEDTNGTEEYQQRMQQFDTKSALFVSIEMRGELVAFVEVRESRQRQEFMPDEIILCQHIAQNAAVAISNARNYQQAQDEIQRRKEIEREIRKLSNVAEQAASAIVVTNLKGVIEFVNPAFSEITGYSQEEAIGQTPNILKSGEHTREFYDDIWLKVEAGEIWRGEIINRRKDGSLYWESQVISPVRDENGEVINYVAIKDDISQAKQYESELRNLSNATEQTANGIVITDVEGHIEYVNPAFSVISGYSQEEIIGKTLDIQRSGEHDEAFYNRLDETIARGEIWKGEIINRRKDGSHYWESQVISPVIDEDGEITHHVLVKEDITNRKELEHALALAHEEALVASDLKTKLLANVSHDMRTPLGAIMGYTEMLQMGVFEPLNDEQNEATRAISASTQRLLDFVNNLLSQAQIETGKIVLNNAPFKPRKLIDLMGAEVSIARTKGLDVNTEIDPSLPEFIVGDSYWLGQVLHNLFSNAIKFTPEPGKITVQFLRRNDEQWALRIADTGKGIPPDAQNYIFETFRQVDGELSRQEHTGSGLGLSIVNHLVTLMNGKIELESEEGAGSAFTIVLPLNPAIEEKIA